MSTYTATIRWRRTGTATSPRASTAARTMGVRRRRGGAGSASPHIVPAPWSDPAGVDPEEAFIASLSSCHMLFFVDFARRAGFVVDSYVDEAEGVLDKRADGRMAMTRVTLASAHRAGAATGRRGGDSPTSTTARTKPASSPIR